MAVKAMTLVGLDVHARRTHAAILDRVSGELRARVSRERGVDVRVVAPGSIPKGCGDRVKTDRRDAVRLVRLLAAGELGFAFVPSVADEHFRDLVRAIEDVRGDLMRARHRVGKFLLRRDALPGTRPHLDEPPPGADQRHQRPRDPRRAGQGHAAQEDPRAARSA